MSIFKAHKLNQQGIGHIEWSERAFQHLLNNIQAVVGHDGEEIEMLKIKLQEASFFTKRAISVQPENQECDVENA